MHQDGPKEGLRNIHGQNFLPKEKNDYLETAYVNIGCFCNNLSCTSVTNDLRSSKFQQFFFPFHFKKFHGNSSNECREMD